MSDDCVPGDEMRPHPSYPDPLDAVLDGVHSADSEEDLLDVAAFVLDLRATYRRGRPLEPGTELAAFTGAHLPEDMSTVACGASAGGSDRDARSGRKRPAMLTTVSGFLATVTGKVLLGSAVAAASVGGLHATDVVEVPVLPDSRPPTQPAGSTGASPTEASDGAEGASEGSQGSSAGGDAYGEAMQAWTDCVAEVAPDRDPDAEGAANAGGPDPTDECGDRPAPADFGISDPDLPDQAADAARDATGGAPGNPGSAGETPAGERPDPTTPEGAGGPESPGGPDGDIPASDSAASEAPAATEPPDTDTPADTAGGSPDQGDDRPGGRP